MSTTRLSYTSFAPQPPTTIRSDAPDGDLGFVDLVIDAPPRIAAMYNRIAAKNAHRPRCPGLGTMEVELSVLHATNLRQKYECYAKVYVQMDEGEPEVKLGNTGMSKEEHTPAGRKPDVYSTANPVWDSTTKNKFVVAIPFPSNWMEAKVRGWVLF